MGTRAVQSTMLLNAAASASPTRYFRHLVMLLLWTQCLAMESPTVRYSHRRRRTAEFTFRGIPNSVMEPTEAPTLAKASGKSKSGTKSKGTDATPAPVSQSPDSSTPGVVAPSPAPNGTPGSTSSPSPALAPSSTMTLVPSLMPAGDKEGGEGIKSSMIPSSVPTVYDPDIFSPSYIATGSPAPNMAPSTVATLAPSKPPVEGTGSLPGVASSAIPSMMPSYGSLGGTPTPNSSPSNTLVPSMLPGGEPGITTSITPSMAPSYQGAPATPTDSTGTDDDVDIVYNGTSVFCPNADASNTELLTWTYAAVMQDGYGAEDANGAVETMEPQLLSNLLSLLECGRVDGRRLAADYGIVGMDYLPVDTRLEEACPATVTYFLPCFVFSGYMYLHLEEGANAEIAFLETRKAIRDLMADTGALPVSKVDRFQYLSPELSDPVSVETNENQDNSANRAGTQTATIPVMVAVGSTFLFIAVFVAFRRRRRNGDDADRPSVLVGSHYSGEMSPANSGSTDNGFSNMLPHAYTQRDPYAMSAILEDSSDTASQTRSSSIIVSDCGYTDDSSRDQSFVNAVQSEEPTLGAWGIDDYEHEDDYLFDNDESAVAAEK